MLSERPTIEKIVVVRHALDTEGYLAPEGREQCKRLAQLADKIRDSEDKRCLWACFSSTAWRAVETALEVSRGLWAPTGLQTSRGLTGARAPVSETMELVSQLDPRIRALLLIVHVDNVEVVIRAVCEQIDPGFRVRLPWDENTGFRVNNTQGVVIDVKYGRISLIDGSIADMAS